MGYPFDRGDNRLLELRLRIFAVVDQVKAVGNHPGFKNLAVTRRPRGPNSLSSLSVVSCRSMCRRNGPCTDRTSSISAVASRAGPSARKFRFGVDGVMVPAIDALIRPGLTQGTARRLILPGIVRGARFEKVERPEDAARFHIHARRPSAAPWAGRGRSAGRAAPAAHNAPRHSRARHRRSSHSDRPGRRSAARRRHRSGASAIAGRATGPVRWRPKAAPAVPTG